MQYALYTYRAKVTNVVDADTLDLTVDLGMRIFTDVRVRLTDIDAPEVYGVKKKLRSISADSSLHNALVSLCSTNGSS